MDSKRNSRRELLKAGAALAGGITLGTSGKAAQAQGHDHPMTPGSENASPMIHGSKEQIEYGQRSKYVTSVRLQHPIGGRPSPDVFGKVFHVATPLQDSVGVITPSSLHYIATTRGSFLPDIDPKQHTLTIHALVVCPLLKECGLKGSAKWFVAEGAEEVKGASSIPIEKAMDDCIIAYGMNGEPLRPQQGFPGRIMVPGFEGLSPPN